MEKFQLSKCLRWSKRRLRRILDKTKGKKLKTKGRHRIKKSDFSVKSTYNDKYN